jgi:choline dehydrogenase
VLTQDFGECCDRRRGLGRLCARQPALGRPKCSASCCFEAGGSDNRLWVHVPVGYLYAMGDPSLDWCLKTEAEPGLNGRALNYPRGKVLGGCSSINGMIYMRGQARDYDLWRQMGNTGWGWDDVLPYFKRSEDAPRRRATTLHGGKRANCASSASA